MKLHEEAAAIYKALKNRHPHDSPWLEFSTDPCPKKIAARNFIDGINRLLHAHPELLMCSLETHPESKYDTKVTPLFLILQLWIQKHYSFIDKYYAQQLYAWLVGIDLILPIDLKLTDSMRREYTDEVVMLLKDYDIISLEFVDIDKLIYALKHQIPFSHSVLQKLTTHVINDQFAHIKNVARGKEQPNLIRSQRAAYFINQMRIELIVDDHTEAKFIDFDCQDSQIPNEYTVSALQFFATQKTVGGFEKLRCSSRELIHAKIESTIHVGDDIYTHKLKHNLAIFEMQHALASKDQVKILAALDLLKPQIGNVATSLEEFHELANLTFKILSLSDLNKLVIAEALLSCLQDRIKLTDDQLNILKADLAHMTYPNPSKIFASILFVKSAPTPEHNNRKKLRII